MNYELSFTYVATMWKTDPLSQRYALFLATHRFTGWIH